MGRLSGKTAIITGSSGDIGRATATEFAKEGANLMLQYRSREKEAMKLVNAIEQLGGRAYAFKLDFLDQTSAEKDVYRLVEATVSHFKRVDILVNLAGYPAKNLWNKRFLEVSAEDLYKTLSVDLLASFICSKAVAVHMLRQKHGVIINTSSTPALAGHNKGIIFAVAKAANLGLTKGLAAELAPYVRVNAIAPGNLQSEWLSELSPIERKEAKAEAPLKRLGKPEEVARLLVFLASDNSSFITGQTIVIDGGTVMH